MKTKFLQCVMGVRYWEDSEVNGIEDTLGTLIPFRKGDYWDIVIDVEEGRIIEWPKGTTANIHYKICDDGEYFLFDKDKNLILKGESYVPNCLAPSGDGFGDYAIMNIDENGKIEDWEFTTKDEENIRDNFFKY